MASSAPAAGNSIRTVIVSLVFLLSCAATPLLRADVNLHWQSDGTAGSATLSEYLSNSNIVSGLLQLINDNFLFDRTLTVAVGGGQKAQYDASTHTIRLPFTYLEQAISAHRAMLPSEPYATAVERALTQVEYTLYHLLGHAFTGASGTQADDKAEALSTYIMLSYWPDGASRWLEAVDAYASLSRDSNHASGSGNYWQTHAMYPQREQLIRCWIEGSQDIDQSGACFASWDNLETTSLQLLQPFLTHDATLRPR